MAANTAVQFLLEDIISVVAPGYIQTDFISGLSFVKKFFSVAFPQTVKRNCGWLLTEEQEGF